MLLIGIGQSKKLTTIFEWQIMDFKYPTTGQRDSSIEAGDFIPKNVIPGGIEVAENRLFVTLPRYKPGVPVSLAYINLSGKREKDIKLFYSIVAKFVFQIMENFSF